MARNEEMLISKEMLIVKDYVQLKKWVCTWVENKAGQPNYDEVIISWLDSVEVPIKNKYLVSCFKGIIGLLL